MATKIEVISRLAARFAEKCSAEFYAPDGPGEGCDIDAIENNAVIAAQAAFDASIAHAMRLKREQLADAVPCPDCGEMREVRTEARTVQGRMGPANIEEAVCTCSACGRDFFPSAGSTAAG